MSVSDTTRPLVAITTPANNENVTGTNITVTGTASDPQSGITLVDVAFNRPDGTRGPYTTANYNATAGTWSVVLPSIPQSGRVEIWAHARNGAGLEAWTNTIYLQTVIINYTFVAGPPPADTIPPTTNITSVVDGTGAAITANSTTTSTTAIVSFSGADDSGGAVTFEGSLDGSAYSPVISALAINNLALGTHTINIRAKDAAGNIDATPASLTWTVGLPPLKKPLVIIEEPANNAAIVGGTVTILGSATADSIHSATITAVDVATLHSSAGQSAYTPATINPTTGSWSFVMNNMATGTLQIWARATDSLGQQAWTNTTYGQSVTVNITNDNPVPVNKPFVHIDTPTEGQVFDTFLVTITGTARDDTGHTVTEVAVDTLHEVTGRRGYVVATPKAPGDWSTWSITLNNLAWNGNYSVFARVTNDVGVQAWTDPTWAQVVNFVIEVEGPPPPGGGGGPPDPPDSPDPFGWFKTLSTAQKIALFGGSGAVMVALVVALASR